MFHSPQPKSVYRTGVVSPSKDLHFFNTRQPHEQLRQKALSFNYEPNSPYQTPSRNPILLQGHHYSHQTHNYQPVSTRVNVAQKYSDNPKSSKQKKFIFDNFFSQSNKSNNPQFSQTYNQNNQQPQNHPDKNYYKDRTLNFESLRSTLTTNRNSFEASHQVPFTSQTNHTPKMTLFHNFTDHKKLSNKPNNLLNPSNLVKIIPNSVNSTFQTKDKLKDPRTHHFSDFLSNKKISHLQELKENVPSFFPLKNRDQKTKRQRKFTSFLICRDDKKQSDQQERHKFQPFQKMYTTDKKQESQEQAGNSPPLKRLMNTKHVKSHSVLQNMCYGHKKSYFQTVQPLNFDIDKNGNHQVKDYMIEKRQRSNSIQEKQTKIDLTINFRPRNVKKEEQRPRIPKQLLAFRQSLDRFNMKVLNIEPNLQKKKQEFTKVIQSIPKKVTFDQKYSKKSEDLIFQKIEKKGHERRQSKQIEPLPKTKNQQTIDDIKQALINCNLFSEQDYKGVFQNHKKDILKHSQNPDTENYQSKIDPSKLKPSIKALVDSFSSQESSQNQSTQDQKKLAQLASMCEQKRSKWILEQTDTIKQSLKQLSQFNTEKSLHQSEWKKLSMKDFSTQRKNQCSVRIDNIYQINEEESLFESKDFKLSSVKILSESSWVQDGHKESDVVAFKKSKSYEDQIILERKDGEFSNVCLEHFHIRWAAEEQVPNGNSQSDATCVLYTAQHRLTKSLYMIKKYDKMALRNLGASFMSSFIQSVRIQMKWLSHPNIEKIYSVFSDKHSFYLLCEYTATKLSIILSRSDQMYLLDSSQQSISLNTVSREYERVDLFREVIDGLEQVHLHNIVHKTLQPNSIRLIWDSCKISCFEGCEVADKPLNAKMSNSYVCPENLFDSIKTAMDIWCLGILGYEILIGKKPFQSDKKAKSKVKKILQCNFDIPSEKAHLCEQVLNMALKRNPKDRASIFDIKNTWAAKLKIFTAIQNQHRIIHNKLASIIQG